MNLRPSWIKEKGTMQQLSQRVETNKKGVLFVSVQY